MKARWAGALAGAFLLTGCVASTPPPPDGIPGAVQPRVTVSADPGLTSMGTMSWEQRLPLPLSSTRKVTSDFGIWLAVGMDPAHEHIVKQFVGSMADGHLMGQLVYGRAVGFPTTGGPAGHLMTAGVQWTGRRNVFTVRAWDAETAEPRWSTRVPAQDPRASVRVAGICRGLVLVRPSVADQGVFQLSGLVALRMRDGGIAWTFRGGQGLRTVTPGPLITLAYRHDAQRDGPITRVAFVRPSDGAIRVEIPWVDYRNHFRPAALALTGNRVLLRGDRDNAGDVQVALARGDGSIVWRREAAAEPAVDLDSGVIAITRRDGSIEALDIMRGTRIWRWTAQQVDDARLQLRGGAYGVFWGNAGPVNIVVDVRTGDPLFTGSLDAIDPARWNGSTLVLDSEDRVSGYRGSGVPIGNPPAEPASHVLFTRLPGTP